MSLHEPVDLRTFIDSNPCVGVKKSGAKRFWTTREIKAVQEHYPTGGLKACLPLLPGRTASSIYQRAGILGLHTEGRAGGRREPWATSDAIDAVIRRVYQSTPSKGDINRLAVTVGRPSWWVTKRASRLGLIAPRFRALPWTEAENDLIQELAHRDPHNIRLALKRAGYERSATAISVQLKRLGACTEDPNHYTAGGLAKLFGVDPKGVTAWIVKGWLQAKRRGTDRVEAQGGDQWWIHRKDVRQFVIENVAAVDLRKVDRFWFVDLLTDPSLKSPKDHSA